MYSVHAHRQTRNQINLHDEMVSQMTDAERADSPCTFCREGHAPTEVGKSKVLYHIRGAPWAAIKYHDICRHDPVAVEKALKR